MQGQTVCIFGGGGFLGRYIAQKLLSGGARVRIAERHVKNAMHIKPLGDLGQTQFASADVTKADSVHRAVSGCDTVINLVGVFGSQMQIVNELGARNVAQAARSAGAQSLIHMSAIGADSQSPSAYGRSKAAGEAAVQDTFGGAVILRPSIVFGQEDQFINRFAGLIQMLPVVPIIGGETKFQPVFVGDVAQAVMNALRGPSSAEAGIYELGGPEIITMSGLNRRIAEMIGIDRTFVEVPDLAARILATSTGFLPGAPISKDQYLMLQKDNIVAAGAMDLSSLNVSPTPLATVAHGWLEQYADHGRFGASAKAG